MQSCFSPFLLFQERILRHATHDSGADLGAQPGSILTNSNAAAAQFDAAAGALGAEPLITFESTPAECTTLGWTHIRTITSCLISAARVGCWRTR